MVSDEGFDTVAPNPGRWVRESDTLVVEMQMGNIWNIQYGV